MKRINPQLIRDINSYLGKIKYSRLYNMSINQIKTEIREKISHIVLEYYDYINLFPPNFDFSIGGGNLKQDKIEITGYIKIHTEIDTSEAYYIPIEQTYQPKGGKR